MAKVTFKRYETDLEAKNSDIIDGQLIVTKEGTTYTDYDDERIPIGINSGGGNNIYSETEKIIGTYQDKTLYRKLIVVSNKEIIGGTTLIDLNMPEISEITKIEGKVKAGAIESYYPLYRNGNILTVTHAFLGTTHRLLFGGNATMEASETTVHKFTIEYTKTTD